jgi:hypothetical protein
LVVRFYGYDVNGNIINPSLIEDIPGTPPSDGSAAFERYFNILITKNDFKLDGKAVVYNFDAVAINLQAAFSTKRGTIPIDTNIQGATIKDILGGDTQGGGLLDKLNQYEKSLVDKNQATIPNVYKVEYETNSAVAKARVLSDAQYDATTSASKILQDAKSNNLKDQQRAGSTIDQSTKKISVRAGTNVLKILDNIITGSTFVTDALNTINGPDVEGKQQVKNDNKPLKWYSVTPLVKILGRDSVRQDWVYEITYQIREFDIPYVRTEYANTKGKYYGPHKRYEYWFTGQNNEVISYEQTFNSLYFITSATGVTPAPAGENNKLGTAVGNVPKIPQPAIADNTQGAGTGLTNEISNQVRTSLYSVGDQAKATIKIIGDPDFLMQDVTNNVSLLSDVFSASKRYGADFSISPNGGQVFIEIFFQQAKDYDAPSGIMKVLDNVDFYQDPRVREAGIRGIVYLVTQVETMFGRGKFEQTLQLVIVPSTSLVTDTPTSNQSDQRAESATTTANTAGGAGNNNARPSRNPNVTAATQQRTGVNVPNAAAGAGRGGGPTAAQLATAAAARQKQASNSQVTSPTANGRVADDDADPRKVVTNGGGAAFVPPSLGRRRKG